MKKTIALMVLLVIVAFVAGATTELPWACTGNSPKTLSEAPNANDKEHSSFQSEPVNPDKPTKQNLLGAILRGSSIHTPQ